MKYLSYIILVILLWSCEQTVYDNPEYTLVFEDNFRSESIDESKWNFEIGTGCQYGPNLNGWGNFEDQYYKKENASIVDNDFLQIEAKEENVLYSDACGFNQIKNYTSARLNTKNKFDFTYGKVEASIKFDKAIGLWHAFWMLPSFPQEIWPYSGEIDILEFANKEGEYFYAGTMHHTGPLIGTDFPYQNENYFNSFHVYSIEWDLSSIKWYVDDVLIQNVVRTSSSVLDDNWPFDKEFHLILNTAVGGTLGGPPNLADQSQFMLVDYVRVYQKNKQLMRYLFIFIFIHSIALAQVVPVEIVKSDKGYELLRDGKPYYIKGVGGLEYLEKAKEYGANSFRTWSTEDAKMYLDKAQELGMTVCLGFWAQHERHGFDWSNEVAVKLQLKSFAKVVDEVKDHPALLMWAVGNEVDLFYSNFDVWKHINDIALMIKSKDPHHPITTVTAGLDVAEVKLIQKYAPDLDLLGVNTYGGLDFAIESLPYYGWDKPYIITEWGPNGHWESPTTDWGIPIEQTSTEKAKSYRERYEMIFADSTNCFGSYVFLWGFKQETTSSWYGLFLKDGTQTSVMDVLIEKWSGQKPTNLAPEINSFTINSLDAHQSVKVDKRSIMEVNVDAFDPNNDKLSYHIEIVPESTDTKSGGDFEKAPMAVFQKVFSNAKFKVKAPSKSGKYRLFVVIKDGEKGATANIPFLVN